MKPLRGRHLKKGTGFVQIPGKGTGILQTLEEKRNGMGTINPEIPIEGKGTQTPQVWEQAHLRTQRGGRWELASLRPLIRGSGMASSGLKEEMGTCIYP